MLPVDREESANIFRAVDPEPKRSLSPDRSSFRTRVPGSRVYTRSEERTEAGRCRKVCRPGWRCSDRSNF